MKWHCGRFEFTFPRPALLMGIVGGVLPAWRAARLQIVDCLRAV